MNENGFEEMADFLGKLADVDPKQVSMESLEDAANFYAEKLIPQIPRSLLKKKHMQDQLKVVVKDEGVEVRFEGTAFYWRFEENGAAGRPAKHFAANTYSQNSAKIAEIMTQKIMDLWKG